MKHRINDLQNNDVKNKNAMQVKKILLKNKKKKQVIDNIHDSFVFFFKYFMFPGLYPHKNSK